MLLNMKRTKGTAAARKRASEIQKPFFSDPENRLKRSIAMKLSSMELLYWMVLKLSSMELLY